MKVFCKSQTDHERSVIFFSARNSIHVGAQIVRLKVSSGNSERWIVSARARVYVHNRILVAQDDDIILIVQYNNNKDASCQIVMQFVAVLHWIA